MLAPEAVVALLGFAALNYLPSLLALAAFVAILPSSRAAIAIRKMVVWFSAGQSLTAWVRPVLVFVLPLVLAIATLSFFVSPWALSQSAEYRTRLDSRRDAGQAATPGIFQETTSGNRVVFVEGIADDASSVKTSSRVRYRAVALA